MSYYRIVLAEGQHDDLIRYLNRGLLVSPWPTLRTLISRDVREAWERSFDELAHCPGHSVDLACLHRRRLSDVPAAGGSCPLVLPAATRFGHTAWSTGSARRFETRGDAGLQVVCKPASTRSCCVFAPAPQDGLTRRNLDASPGAPDTAVPDARSAAISVVSYKAVSRSSHW